ncbi:hypothetical protein CCACVL1_18209, partial [Corchorus capsularis]
RFGVGVFTHEVLETEPTLS